MKHDELNWLAFRYVAGELSADEQAAFEARLDTEQPAREAVAREVELAQAVAIAAGSLAPQSARVTPAGKAEPVRFALSVRSASWLSLGAAASLAIGMVLGSMLLGRALPWNRTGDELARSQAAVQELAGFWQPIEMSDDVAVRDATDDTAEEMMPEAPGADVPGWLLAALEPEEPADSTREN
jgi:anti-sigma factor RsiW